MRKLVPLATLALLALTGCATSEIAAVDTKEPAPTTEAIDAGEAVDICRTGFIHTALSSLDEDGYPPTAEWMFDSSYDVEAAEVEAADGGWTVTFEGRTDGHLGGGPGGTITCDWDGATAIMTVEGNDSDVWRY
ncbi:hypothetical protein [Gulosibacter sediminis]|uniref:hypothetical protein n=1 Tax=Gulosibacter sediminis TaxID=1729695 RepID=UPI0024A98D48|nr:hypothetical protein [Gulosibacter sediminis]